MALEIDVMTLSRRTCLHLALSAPLGSAVPRAALSQGYPIRPISMLVPYAAGGPGDTVARILAERMRTALGYPVIIENVTGANGSIAVGRVARAVPDGYTLSLGLWNTHVSNGALYSLPYDVLNDFEPISLLASFSSMIAVRKSLPAVNLREFVAWLKEDAHGAFQGSAGIGSMGHIAGIYLQNITGASIQHVPYRGSAPAMQDLVSGQIDMMVDAPATLLPHLRAGTIKVLAVLSKSRLQQAPDVPTADEAGLSGFYVSNWFGLWAPKGTAQDVIGKLNAAVVSALADPAARGLLNDLGYEIPPRDQQAPEALRAFQRAEIEKWWPIIRAARINAG